MVSARALGIGVLEFIVGVAWGVVLSLYAKSMVDSGVDGGLYGLLGLILSTTSILSLIITGLMLDKGFRLHATISAGVALSLGLYLINYNYDIITSLLVVLALGYAMGSHNNISIYTLSLYSRGYPIVFTIAYSLSLLGFSLGALLIALKINIRSLLIILIILVLLSFLAYSTLITDVHGNTKLTPRLGRVSRSIVLVTLIVLLTGLSLGMSVYNYDYYIVALLGLDEASVGLTLSIASIAASITVLFSSLLINTFNYSIRFYSISMATQALAITLLAYTSSSQIAPLFYALRSSAGIVADSLLDSIYTRIVDFSMRGLTIAIVLTSYEVGLGLGKLVGSSISGLGYDKPMIIGSIIIVGIAIFSSKILNVVDDRVTLIYNSNLKSRREAYNETTSSYYRGVISVVMNTIIFTLNTLVIHIARLHSYLINARFG